MGEYGVASKRIVFYVWGKAIPTFLTPCNSKYYERGCRKLTAGLPPEPYIRLSYPINALFYVESVKVSP